MIAVLLQEMQEQQLHSAELQHWSQLPEPVHACLHQDTTGLEGGVVLPTVNGAGLKRKGQRGGGADEGALQTQNGQGDTLSQSSSILQVWACSRVQCACEHVQLCKPGCGACVQLCLSCEDCPSPLCLRRTTGTRC